MKKKPTIVCELTPEELSIVFPEIHAQVYITNLRKKYTYEQVDNAIKYCREYLEKEKQEASL